MARNHKSKQEKLVRLQTNNRWLGVNLKFTCLNPVVKSNISTPGFSYKQKISAPEQKYPPLSSWPAKHNSTRPALTPKPGLQHWLTLHSRARVNNVQQSTQASKWSGWFYSGHRQTHTGWCSPRLGALRWHSAPLAYPTPHSTTAHLLLLVFLQQSLLLYC